VKSVLTAQQAVAIGFSVYQSFENPDPHGFVPIPNTSAGARCLVYGYDDDAARWIIRNQWG